LEEAARDPRWPHIGDLPDWSTNAARERAKLIKREVDHDLDFGISRLPKDRHLLQCEVTLLALNVIHGAAKVWSLSDQQRTNCAVGLEWLRSV
jgi:hypothetical protein